MLSFFYALLKLKKCNDQKAVLKALDLFLKNKKSHLQLKSINNE